MQLDLTGRNALIAGGSRGIGRSIALTFAQAGANVSICARGESVLRETETELRRIGHAVHAMTCDLGNGTAVANYVTAAAQALGGIDVLVNNASGFGASDDEAGWAASINVDLLGSVRASRAALPYLEKSRGSIIHISSIAGQAERAHAALRRGQSGVDAIHADAGGTTRGQTDTRELYRAGFDRVSGRKLGAQKNDRPGDLQFHTSSYPLRTFGDAAGNRECRAVPGE